MDYYFFLTKYFVHLLLLIVNMSFSARKCRRDQFECRSNGECIAIYNACDGIQQCADGSDEAPVLGIIFTIFF